jgi:predicted O-linked N-acetylglucosamine transferase (SPINDLY family)
MSIRGIRPSRLIFGGLLPRPQYLARYYVTDLFLDTSPYNSGATASDALRMGLPVLTCVGDSFASRMAASILKSVGMPELITSTTEQYESLAIEMATNPDKLMAITTKLEQSLPMSQLYNTADFTYNLEKSYSIIYAKYQENDHADHVYCS